MGKEKLKSKKTDMLRSVSKQSGESVGTTGDGTQNPAVAWVRHGESRPTEVNASYHVTYTTAVNWLEFW